MPLIPSAVIFTCEKCGRKLHTDARRESSVFPFFKQLAINPNGACKKCLGESWTISLAFAELSTELDFSLLSLLTLPLLGSLMAKTTTAVNIVNYPGVPATAIAGLVADPKNRTQRIAALASELEHQQLAALGGKHCPTCGAKFVPHPDKPWTQNGYCMRVCDPVLASTYKPEPESLFTSQRSTLSAKCPAGHDFEVAASFRGLLRACPQCGAKTKIQ